MEKDRVTVDQLALMLMLVIAGGKFLALPSILADEVGRDSWIVMCLVFAVDAVCLCFLLWSVRLNKDGLSVDRVLDLSLGKVIGKLLLAILFVIYMSRQIVLIGSCYEMFAVTFDINTNWLFFALPVVAVTTFALTRGFTAMARVSQILFGLVTISVVALLVNPLLSVRWSQLLPFAEAGWGNMVNCAAKQSYWFSDYIFMYFVLDKVKVRKHLYLPIMSVFIVGAVITVVMDIVFVTLYGSFAPHFRLAMSKIGAFSLGDGASGRWDWLTLSLWVTSVLLKITLFFYCAYKSLEKIFEFRHDKINWFAVGSITLLLMLPMFVSTDDFMSVFLANAVIPFAVVQFVLPVAYPLLTRIATNKAERGVYERT